MKNTSITNYYLKQYENDKIHICSFDSNTENLMYELYSLILHRNNDIYVMKITHPFFYDSINDILNDINTIPIENIELIKYVKPLTLNPIIIETFNNFDELKEKYVEYFI